MQREPFVDWHILTSVGSKQFPTAPRLKQVRSSLCWLVFSASGGSMRVGSFTSLMIPSPQSGLDSLTVLFPATLKVAKNDL